MSKIKHLWNCLWTAADDSDEWEMEACSNAIIAEAENNKDLDESDIEIVKALRIFYSTQWSYEPSAEEFCKRIEALYGGGEKPTLKDLFALNKDDPANW